jgi:enoyl-CoA hydratase
LKDLDEALDAVQERVDAGTLRGLMLKGAGEKAFVAGADIGELSGLEVASGERLSARGQALFQRIEDLAVPSVAVVDGFALGGGAELAMACHMRIAGEKATFGLPEVSLGLIPGYGGTQRLAALVGQARAIEYIASGAFIDAATAERIGLVNRVAEDPEGEALKLLGKIGKQAPVAVRSAIRAIRGGVGAAGAAGAASGAGSAGDSGAVTRDSIADGYALEAALFGQLCGTDDFKEGTTAFLEKRKPGFTGK